jgi:hypothetical protein
MVQLSERLAIMAYEYNAGQKVDSRMPPGMDFLTDSA